MPEESLTSFFNRSAAGDGRPPFPLVAMVGQEKLKRALILNVINPEIGGVLIRGGKGVGKSTAVEGLKGILPQIEGVKGCRYNCDPDDEKHYCPECRLKKEQGTLERETRTMQVVKLPLNITEDRLIGSIDIEKALTEGTKAFEPGLLAKAHRNILYVDQINLLEDNVVDLLLDAAAMGMVAVEREGISVSYQSKFIFIGTMNPEEGELRPQLLDRLALQVEVETIRDVKKRVEITKRMNAYSENPVAFKAQFREEEARLKERIERARELLPQIETPEKILYIITRLGVDFSLDGHRGDIIMERTAQTNAAYEGRTEVLVDDVLTAAEMALPHRMRKQPFEEEKFSYEMLKKLVDSY